MFEALKLKLTVNTLNTLIDFRSTVVMYKTKRIKMYIYFFTFIYIYLHIFIDLITCDMFANK